jgi:hypothetical protein
VPQRERQLSTWGWDWIRDAYQSKAGSGTAAARVEHRPGVRTVTAELGAHCTPGRQTRSRTIRVGRPRRTRRSRGGPRWVQAMDGLRMPFQLARGLPVTSSAHATDERLLAMALVQYRRPLSLGFARAPIPRHLRCRRGRVMRRCGQSNVHGRGKLVGLVVVTVGDGTRIGAALRQNCRLQAHRAWLPAAACTRRSGWPR